MENLHEIAVDASHFMFFLAGIAAGVGMMFFQTYEALKEWRAMKDKARTG